MLMISADAAGEAERLQQQATKIEPTQLEDGLLRRVTRIDGAVLVDLEGRCHAIGVILDGPVSPRCTPSRGARYNSAIRYVHGRHEAGKKDCFAVLKSEDGMIDLVPHLMPPIRRSELEAALTRLEAVDPRAAQVVVLRFFSGMSSPEVAEHLNLSLRTVESDWTHARAWLRRELAGTGDSAPKDADKP